MLTWSPNLNSYNLHFFKLLFYLFQQSNTALVNTKSEVVEDTAEVEQMEPEADPVSAASEMDGATEENVKEEEGEDHVDEESTDKKADTPVLCTLEQLTRLAQRLGADWKKLAPKLGFRDDEVTKSSLHSYSYFVPIPLSTALYLFLLMFVRIFRSFVYWDY